MTIALDGSGLTLEKVVRIARNGETVALDPKAVDRIDLLTVVEHELGHMLGLSDLDASVGSLMSGQLANGTRRAAGTAERDAIWAGLE